MFVKELKIGELFSGPGGLALAAKETSLIVNKKRIIKFKHVWANDNDKNACETFKRNICPESPEKVIYKDVKELDIEKLENIDGFSFGFPCNDYSIVGEQCGLNGCYGQLYEFGVKVLNFHNPMFFLAENVGGLQNANDGIAFKKILNELENAGKGYNIVPNLYKFEEYGVPQKRHRIIIVGFRKDLGLKFQVPAPTHINNFKTVFEALNFPPIDEITSNHEFTKHPPIVIERLQNIPPGENVWYSDLPEHLKLNVKGAKLSQIYKRLHPDEPAYTITGSGGGGTHVYHYKEPRALTNRERARLQTFPDDYIFIGSKENVRKQIGMAVPPVGAKIVYLSILKTIENVSYKFIKPSLPFEHGEFIK